jgi:hypothetical protein
LERGVAWKLNSGAQMTLQVVCIACSISHLIPAWLPAKDAQAKDRSGWLWDRKKTKRIVGKANSRCQHNKKKVIS